MLYSLQKVSLTLLQCLQPILEARLMNLNQFACYSFQDSIGLIQTKVVPVTLSKCTVISQQVGKLASIQTRNQKE